MKFSMNCAVLIYKWVMQMELIDREELYHKLDSIGGCGADKDSWADGWDCAITEAIRLLEAAPTIKSDNCKNYSQYKTIEGR